MWNVKEAVEIVCTAERFEGLNIEYFIYYEIEHFVSSMEMKKMICAKVCRIKIYLSFIKIFGF